MAISIGMALMMAIQTAVLNGMQNRLGLGSSTALCKLLEDGGEWSGKNKTANDSKKEAASFGLQNISQPKIIGDSILQR